eukprot:48198-Eustigmatos_ZCMA.PRE.1
MVESRQYRTMILGELQDNQYYENDAVVVYLDSVTSTRRRWTGYGHDETRSIFLSGPPLDITLKAGDTVMLEGFRAVD